MEQLIYLGFTFAYAGFGWLLGEKISDKWLKKGWFKWFAAGLVGGIAWLFLLLIPVVDGTPPSTPLLATLWEFNSSLMSTIWGLTYFSMPVVFGGFGFFLGEKAFDDKVWKFVGLFVGGAVGGFLFLLLTFALI